ncbi:hypothetical protein SAMN04488587_0417 [Methanococcoides vulcani]|uniref:Uncharacterized protein n=1 Tax=Methanococcoides vulcani TaxID=1353158 RepID=A0A1H9YC07_9EURY|nr:hypothetical protein SAMN04488587_0417 [Methanococcoides vulcani]
MISRMKDRTAILDDEHKMRMYNFIEDIDNRRDRL